MNLKTLWKKLFSTYLVLGLLNILLALIFLYNSSTAIIKERAINQLFAVSAFAEHELSSFFENLKAQSVQHSKSLTNNSHFESFRPSLFSVSIVSKRKQKAIYGPALKGPLSNFDSHRPLTFYPFGKNQFSLVVPYGDEKIIWVFSYEGLSEILARREGMGESGEVYLVGEDNYIKGGSRHVADWQNTKVDNKSVQNARKNGKGTELVKDYRGVEVLSTFTHFNVDELHFVLLSEIDEDEVFAPLNKAFPKVLFLCLVFLVLTVFVAFFSTRKISKTLNKMRKQLNEFNLNIINTVEEESARLSDVVANLVQDLKELKTDPKQNEELFQTLIEKLVSMKTTLNSEEEIARAGLFQAIEDFVKKEGEAHKVETNLWVNKRVEEINFSPVVRRNIYRIIQEIVSQLILLRATQLSLVITKQGHDMVIRAEGISAEKIVSPHFPQLLMYRVDLLEGEANHSIDEHSIVLTLCFPMARSK